MFFWLKNLYGSVVGLCSPQKRKPTIPGSVPAEAATSLKQAPIDGNC